MSAWDIFHADSNEVLRNQGTAEVREALASGRLRDDDLARPAGSRLPWTPLVDIPTLSWPQERLTAQLGPTTDFTLPATETPPSTAEAQPATKAEDSQLALPVTEADLAPAEPPPVAAAKAGVQEEQEEGAFVLVQQEDDKVEELDLTAMVDIAMQLIMFFLITSTTVFFKSLEIPTPDPEKPKSAQQAVRSLDELEDTNILVEIDALGQLTVDHEPITVDALIPKLRASRDATGRTGILLMADYATHHRNAVLVLEAANEIGLATRLGRLSGGGGDDFGGGPGG